MAYGINAPFGLQARRILGGSLWNGQQSQYFIASGYGTSLFTGDPIAPEADGTIVRGVAGTGIIGVFNGVKYVTDTAIEVFAPYWPANQVTQNAANAFGYVIDDPNTVFDVQASNSANTAFNITKAGVAQADLNNNANFALGNGPAAAPAPYNLINPAGGNTVSGQSAYYLDVNTINTTADLSLKILGLTPTTNPANVFFGSAANNIGQFNNVEVIINNHCYKGGTGTLGV